MTLTESIDPLSRVQAYQLALEALGRAKVDSKEVGRDETTAGVATQLVRAAGSIAANIAEGYCRSTTADRRRFLEYALGSTRECAVWYAATNLPDAAERTERLTSIRRLLLTMIRTCRESVARDSKSFTR